MTWICHHMQQSVAISHSISIIYERSRRNVNVTKLWFSSLSGFKKSKKKTKQHFSSHTRLSDQRHKDHNQALRPALARTYGHFADGGLLQEELEVVDLPGGWGRVRGEDQVRSRRHELQHNSRVRDGIRCSLCTSSSRINSNLFQFALIILLFKQ